MNGSSAWRKGVTHCLLLLGLIVTVFPFFWMLSTSLKTRTESIIVPPTVLPRAPNLQGYFAVFQTLPFGTAYLNTFVSALIIVFAQLLFSSMAAYGFARIRFPGRTVIFVILLSVLMIPGQIFIIPQYLIVQNLGLLDTMGGLVLPGLFSIFGTFLLRQYFLSLPKELEESAILDGCNRLVIYYRVMLPLTKPGLVALTIFTGKYAWNNFMWPLIVTTSPNKMTLAPTLARLAGDYENNFPAQMAGAVMTVVPIILLFFIFQKQFITGIANTGIKG